MPIDKHFRSDLDLAKIDWTKVDATSDAEIQAQVDADEDTAPIFSAQDLAAAARIVQPPTAEDVRLLRLRLGLTQEAFAARYGFSVHAVRQYETARRVPNGPVRTLLRVIAQEPDAVTRALARSARLNESDSKPSTHK